MRSAILACSLLISSLSWGADVIKEFVQDLTRAQRGLMTEFLLTVVEDQGGYVLFGDKPMSFQSYDLSSLHDLVSPNPKTLAVLKGKELWEDLNVSSNNKDYVLSVFEEGSQCRILCVNRKAFHTAVKENLPLFKYVLGSSVTADGLMKEVVDSKGQFSKVLKNDRVLEGILMGHGRQNALLDARLSYLQATDVAGAKDEFPLVSQKLSKAWSFCPQKYAKSPSFGFASVSDEEVALHKMVAFSGKLKPFATCEIPSFVCEVGSDETAALLNGYEQNRHKILKAVGSKNFLEDTLRKLFTASGQTVERPSIPKLRELSLPENREETMGRLVELIQRKIAMEPYAAKKFQAAFMQGVAARERGRQMPVPYQVKRSCDIQHILSEIACCENLEKADAYFHRLAQRTDLTALVPDGVYFKVIKAGKDEALSVQTNKVSFQYSFQILGDAGSKDWGVVKQEDLAALIPGMGYALLGMQKGEERLVYIHPKYAYGEETFFPPNVSIVAQLRLLDFSEGTDSIVFLPPHELEHRDAKDLLARFEVLRGEEYFDEGVEFWNSIKKSGDFFDFKTFQKLYDSQHGKESSFSNVHQEGKFIADLGYHLISLQKKN